MTFIVGSVVIGAGAALAGGAIAAKGSKDAAKIAAGGSEREIKYLEESRDMARADQAPYREAGYTALDKLMEMTGLDRQSAGQVLNTSTQPVGRGPAFMDRGLNDGVEWQSNRSSSYGGGVNRPRVQQRAGGGQLYNVNELGPESIFSNGSYTRNANPQTLPQDPTGYVKPAGRAVGGRMSPNIQYGGGQVGWAGPPRVQGGGPSTAGPVSDQPYNGPRTPNTYNSEGMIIGRGGAPDASRDGNYATPVENPYSIETDPGYQFRFGEGMRGLEGSAAARGGLLSGGFGRKAIRYGQDYATAEFTNIYNRVANIAGLGQVSAQSSGNQAIGAGQGMGRAASEGAVSSAYGQQGSANAWANAGNQIAQLPWGQVFGNDNTDPKRPGLGGGT